MVSLCKGHLFGTPLLRAVAPVSLPFTASPWISQFHQTQSVSFVDLQDTVGMSRYNACGHMHLVRSWAAARIGAICKPRLQRSAPELSWQRSLACPLTVQRPFLALDVRRILLLTSSTDEVIVGLDLFHEFLPVCARGWGAAALAARQHFKRLYYLPARDRLVGPVHLRKGLHPPPFRGLLHTRRAETGVGCEVPSRLSAARSPCGLSSRRK